MEHIPRDQLEEAVKQARQAVVEARKALEEFRDIRRNMRAAVAACRENLNDALRLTGPEQDEKYGDQSPTEEG